MLVLENKITLDQETIDSANLTSKFTADDLTKIGLAVWEGYDLDKRSRSAWERRTNAAMNLAMQLVEDKNFPWANCANIAFPLVTIAALQFHSRAYPQLVVPPEIVKCRVPGADPTGVIHERAYRIGCHMSYQVLEEDAAWEAQHDALLINLPIVGCAFKKSQFNARLQHNVSELVLAKDLVINYWAKSLESAERKTHCIPLSHNDIRERCLRGTYRDITSEGWFQGVAQAPEQTTQQQQADRRLGTTPPQADLTTPFNMLEQHCCLDLDKDGYAEPYVITVEEISKTVVRIVTRFSRLEDIEFTESKKILSITPIECFTKYPFIPSPDGGIYDVGFGVFLGPLNETTNSLIDQLLDAGTMQTTGGGFLGRGAKIRGGVYTFKPFEWARVDSTGDDLRKSVFPLPVNAPSEVLFNLLSLIINYANRIPGTTEVMVGESPGQNTPAETSRNLMEQGMKIYNAIFKRVWRAMKDEFKKLYILNARHMPLKRQLPIGFALREDYLGDPNEVCPAADPNIVSDSQEMTRIMAIKQSASGTPGYDLEELERRFLRALKMDGVEKLYPGIEAKPPGKSEKITIAEMKQQGEQLDLQWEQQKFAATLMEEQRLNAAQITKLEAEAVTLLGNMQGDAEDRQVAMINAELGMRKTQDETLRKRIDLVLKRLDIAKKIVEVDVAKVKGAAAKEKANAGTAE